MKQHKRMMMLFLITVLTILFPVVGEAIGPATLTSDGVIQVLKISAQDERAVIKMPDGKVRVVKIGDSLGNNSKIIEIAKDKIVVEKRKDSELETVIIRLENGTQRVERLRKLP